MDAVTLAGNLSRNGYTAMSYALLVLPLTVSPYDSRMSAVASGALVEAGLGALDGSSVGA